MRCLFIALVFSVCIIPTYAADTDRDFSGKWFLDSAASRLGSLEKIDAAFTVSQSDVGLLCSTESAKWSYALDGSETRKRIGQESRNSTVKWEGAALLIDTLVSGTENYTVMDRWRLSRDHNTLTITRQVVRMGSEIEGTLVYRREGTTAAPAPAEAPAAAPALSRRPEPGLAPDVTVPSGTRVLLSLIGEISTKHAQDGDKVYFQTAVPVAAGGRVVITRGSDVTGTITHAKAAGHIKGKGELYIRFDTLVLPNGVSRDFRARPPGEEGKVQGNGKAADGRTVMAGAGMGGTIGAITRGLPGAAVGGAGGALAGVLLSRNQDIVLRQGTHMEMVLDRDVVFHSDEIPMGYR